MTEVQWLKSNDADAMLKHLKPEEPPDDFWRSPWFSYSERRRLQKQQRASERKLSLFFAACLAATDAIVRDFTIPCCASSTQVNILRCIFGNPFRPVSIAPAILAWNDRTIPNLAQAIYDERELPSGHLDAARLAILADALEEAGCTNADILGHCRSLGPHVRGCWVVDLLLGKT